MPFQWPNEMEPCDACGLPYADHDPAYGGRTCPGSYTLAQLDAIQGRGGCPVPPITDPLGKSWDQPDPVGWKFTSTHVWMTRADFEKLKDYSATNPSGVYAGKMWRRHDGAFDPEWRAKGGKPEWILRWWGLCDDPGHVSNEGRTILLLDANIDALK